MKYQVHPSHTLLPRSTGLHTSLLALSQIPSLYLMDVTIAYPGIPRSGYGQSHYTLRSIFMDAIPPPEVVYHVRLYNVQKDVPLRVGKTEAERNINMSLSDRKEAAQAAVKEPGLLEPDKEDKRMFDTWLRERWMEKDAWIEDWKQRGEVGPLVPKDRNKNIQEITLPLKLRNTVEVMDAFVWFAPLILFWFIYRSL